MSGRFSGHDPQHGADTAGVPWAGRTLTGTGFDGDTGAADAHLAALLSDPGTPVVELVAAVAAARLIVPVVAVPGEVDTSSGLAADASSDMASVTLVAPDGQRALPAFTSTGALTRWDPQARPVPVTARRAALAAVEEGCEVIPVDLGADRGAAAYTLRPSMVWALATGRVWLPAHQDAELAATVATLLRDEGQVTGHRLGGSDGALELALQLTPGLSQAQVQALVARIGQALSADTDARSRMDSLAFRLLAG